MEIVHMLPEDWPQVKWIYEQGIATGMATFENTAPAWEEWDKAHLPFGRLVAKRQKTILGWVALSPVTDRCVYKGVAEISVYVSPDHRGQGVGKALLNSLIKVSESNGIWTINAAIFPENQASIQLHQGLGFRIIGYREKIARKNGVWKDNVLLERRSGVVGVD